MYYAILDKEIPVVSYKELIASRYNITEEEFNAPLVDLLGYTPGVVDDIAPYTPYQDSGSTALEKHHTFSVSGSSDRIKGKTLKDLL